MKKLLLSIILLVLPSYAHAFYYWVDDTGTETVYTSCQTGTSAPPAGSTSGYCSKSTGLASVNTNVAAGDTVYFRGGTYSGIATQFINPSSSGTSANKITYATYSNEVVNVVGTDNMTVAAVWIANKNWIKVTGYDGSTTARNFKFSNFALFMWIGDGDTGAYPYSTGSNNNEIAYCEFFQPNPWALSVDPYRYSMIWNNSSYNWVHHSTFRDMGGYPLIDATLHDAGLGLDIGYMDCGGPGDSEDNICHDTTSNNVVEDSVFYHNGHHNIAVMNKYNVVRNNVFHNEQWWQSPLDTVWYGYVNVYIYGEFNADYAHSYNLFENNTLSHNAHHYINTGTFSLKVGSSYNVIRHNNIFAGALGAIHLEEHTGASQGVTSGNHFYNNTLMSNGYNAALPDADNLGNYRCGGLCADTDRAAITLVDRAVPHGTQSWWTSNMYANVFKNNLFWKNYAKTEGAVFTVNGLGTIDNCGAGANERCGATVITPNWYDAQGDPKFVSEGAYGSPSNEAGNKEWYWGSNNPNGSDITTLVAQPNFALQSDSPAKDIAGGGNLTTAHGSSSDHDTTHLHVNDAKYFQPGWGKWSSGGPSIAADTIAVGTVGNTVLISSIDYTTNIITLAAPISWSDGASVWLYRNSSGTQVLYGSAPDYGANEFNPATVTATGVIISGGVTFQ